MIDEDLLPGHLGSCQLASDFSDQELKQIAARVTSKYAGRFHTHRFRIEIRPISISYTVRFGLRHREAYEGEGVAFRLLPADDVNLPVGDWWSEQEADMSVRERHVSDAEWIHLHSSAEVEEMLEEQAERYLAAADKVARHSGSR